jgi:hypothetical protein
MTSRILKPMMFLRDRWRWVFGRCPRCSRDLYSAFPYYMADEPNCPVCKGETKTSLSMWRRHRTSGPAITPGAVVINE